MNRMEKGESPSLSDASGSHGTVWVVLVATGLFSALGATLLNALFPDWRLIHYPLHAAVESVGAFAAFIVAVLILGLRNHGHLGTAYTWVAAALIGMGLLDGMHSLMHQGANFVWLHSVATFLGGMTFMGVWAAARWAKAPWIGYVPTAVLITATTIGLGSLIFPGAVPTMVVDGHFSPWARLTNILGGAGFLIASGYFALRSGHDTDDRNRMVFSAHCFLFGLSGIIFEFSVIWDAAWWFWHALRICAYMIAVAFYFNFARRIERSLHTLKGALEHMVEERTASLVDEVKMRTEAEAALRKLGRAVDQSPLMIFITDTDGVIEYVNPKFEEFTGYTPAEAIGDTPRLIKSPDTPPEVYKDLWDTLLAGKDWFAEIKDRRKDGSVYWARAFISPIRDPDGNITHYVAMHEDITERKQAEEAMAEARRAAEVANKAKTELLANMSHELRTPLNAIIGFSASMKDSLFGPHGNDKYLEYSEYIHSSGNHLLELINDILDVSAVEAGRMELHEEPVSIIDISEAAIRILLPKAHEAGISISGISEPDLPRILGDERRLKQIFLNLLSNAVKFTPDGGIVSCDAYIDADGAMVATVTDTGIGMDEEGIAKALSAFGQVDSSLARKHEGTGLGLPLTKGLIELHGGTLALKSAPGQGTKATVTFPRERVLPSGTDG